MPAPLPERGRDRKEDPPVSLHRDHERGVRRSAALAFPEQGMGWAGEGASPGPGPLCVFSFTFYKT